MKKLITTAILMYLGIVSHSPLHAIVMPATNQQGDYRWRNDDGHEASATYIADLNTPIIHSDHNKVLRLRVNVYNATT